MTEYDAADRGGRGVILRRKGLYSSHLIEWREAADAGARTGLGPATRDRREREIEQLWARAEKAEAELARSRAALDLMGKAQALLESLSESAEAPDATQAVETVIVPLIEDLATLTSVATACALLGRARPAITVPGKPSHSEPL